MRSYQGNRNTLLAINTIMYVEHFLGEEINHKSMDNIYFSILDRKNLVDLSKTFGDTYKRNINSSFI